MASHGLKPDPNPEAALSAQIYQDEKVIAETSVSNAHSLSPPKIQRRKMPSTCRSLLITLSICLVLGLGFTQAVSIGRKPCSQEVSEVLLPQVQRPRPAEPDSSFAALLRSASPEAIHRLLHEYLPEKYQHGIFESDREAIEAARAADLAADSPLARIAKRQDGNNNTSVITPPDTTTSVDQQSSTVVLPPDTTSAVVPDTTDPPTPPVTTASPSASPSVETPPADTTTNKAPETTEAPAGPSTSSSLNVPPNSESTTAPVESQGSPDSQTTDSESRMVTSTRKLQTFTQTLPDGKVTVITSTSFVEATGSKAAGSTSTLDPDLQNSVARVGASSCLLLTSTLVALFHFI